MASRHRTFPHGNTQTSPSPDLLLNDPGVGKMTGWKQPHNFHISTELGPWKPLHPFVLLDVINSHPTNPTTDTLFAPQRAKATPPASWAQDGLLHPCSIVEDLGLGRWSGSSDRAACALQSNSKNWSGCVVIKLIYSWYNKTSSRNSAHVKDSYHWCFFFFL